MVSIIFFPNVIDRPSPKGEGGVRRFWSGNVSEETKCLPNKLITYRPINQAPSEEKTSAQPFMGFGGNEWVDFALYAAKTEAF